MCLFLSPRTTNGLHNPFFSFYCIRDVFLLAQSSHFIFDKTAERNLFDQWEKSTMKKRKNIKLVLLRLRKSNRK